MNSNSKLTITAGILNTVLGVILFGYAVLLTIMAFVCLLLVITPLIIAAIPLFFIFCFIAILALGSAIANEVTGIGSIITSSKGGTPSRIFSIISLVVDAVIIPANALTLIYNVYGLTQENESFALWIVLIITGSLCIALAVSCLILNATALKNTKKPAPIQ